MDETEVELMAVSQGTGQEGLGPEELSAYGAYGCFEQETSYEVFKDHLENKNESEREESVKEVLKNSIGKGHGAVSDQSMFIFSIKDLPRAATLHFVLPEYLMHLQQSMRRATPERGYVLPDEIKNSDMEEEVREVLNQSFETYKKLVENNIPKEDARFLLPLYTKTNIQTAGNPRALMHLYDMTRREKVPTPVRKVVNQMMEKAKERTPTLFKDLGYNYETLSWYPAAQLYAERNSTLKRIIKENSYPKEPKFIKERITEEAMDKAIKERDEAELSNLKHIHDGGKFQGFLSPMSLACFHQSIRQRTWNHSVESIYSSAKRGSIVIPPSIKNSEHREEFKKQHTKMVNLYKSLKDEGISKEEAIGIVPHSLELYDFIHVDGWNSVHSIGKRTCTKAQWEIREIANKIAERIRERNPIVGKYAYPQGVVYGECPENDSCGLCEKIRKKREEQTKL